MGGRSEVVVGLLAGSNASEVVPGPHNSTNTTKIHLERRPLQRKELPEGFTIRDGPCWEDCHTAGGVSHSWEEYHTAGRNVTLLGGVSHCWKECHTAGGVSHC